MTMRICRTVVLVLVAVTAGALVVHAQRVTAKIPFEFKAGKQTLPSGSYQVSYDKSDPNVLTLRNQSSGTTAKMAVATRLAAKDQPNLGAHLVFDKVESAHTLAEFWLPGMDGFFLGGEMTTHTHVTINAAK